MGAFVRGTQTFFNQSTAPTGWTKQTTFDDYTLRVVSGTSGNSNYGSNGVSTAFVDGTWPGTITGVTGSVVSADGDLPSHNHPFGYVTVISLGQIMVSYTPTGQYVTSSIGTKTAAAAGTGSAHTHIIQLGSGTITGNPTGFAVTYVDFILAAKS